MLNADDLDVTSAPGFYQVLTPGSAYPLTVAIKAPGGVEGFASELRAVAAEVDPQLRVLDIRDLSRVGDSLWRESEFLYQILAGVSLVALALSLTAIFSVLSLTVTQRTREIGIRVALGSSRRNVVATTLGGTLPYLAAGIAVGAVLVMLLVLAGGGGLTVAELGFVLTYSVCMLGVFLLACLMPTRRALDIEPMDALRTEG
jgi:ABC-type antimicrobial peptide transport system permease subunit